MVPGIEHKSFLASDGTRIAYQVRGPVGAPAVVLANGLGGTFEAFRHIYSALGERYRILCWDYRGLYRSDRPKDLRTLAVPHHCRDLATLLAVENVARAVFIGWSMGVQVNFELFRQHRHLIQGVVAINGTYGTPFRSALASRLTRYVIPALLAAMKAEARVVSAVTRRAVAWDGLVPLIVKSGLAGATIDREALAELAADFKDLDFALYAQLMAELGKHDARDLLPAIDVPVLIITGDKDAMTPLFIARRMNQRIVGSRLFVLTGGSHYTPLEFGREVGDEVRRFVGSLRGYKVAEAA
jgi:pimeloyl-ACP methyl ester carboxylesterase